MKRETKKIIISITTLTLTFFLWIVFCYYRISSENDKYKKHLNTEFVLENDTLTIINYSTFLETYTLSNGVEINAYLILNK